MAETKVEWTATILPDGTSLPGYSFNPWVGCQSVSDACDHCYARAQVTRYGNDFSIRRRTSNDNWKKPLRWNREAERTGIRRKVLCASWADVFDNQVPPEWRVDLWRLIDATPWLDWLLLTKRPQNAARMIVDARRGLFGPSGADIDEKYLTWPWPNVWIGATVENQIEADRRIPYLLSVPAVVRFLSCEPLLDWIDLVSPIRRAVLAGRIAEGNPTHPISWVIAGGESGPKRRRVNLDHMRSLRDQCDGTGVAFFGKQADKVTQLPADLMVREFPHAA